MVIGETVADGAEEEARVAGEPGMYVAVAEKAAVDVMGVEEGDVEAGKGEELGEL